MYNRDRMSQKDARGDHTTVKRRDPGPDITRRELLVFVGGTVAVHPLPERGAVHVGRSSACEIRIDVSSVSRQHARLRFEGARVFLDDLGSSNGTKLGGEWMDPGSTRELDGHALLEVGDATLVIKMPSRAASTASTPAADADPMARVRQLVELVARSNLHVLVLGETGAGKEVVADAIHRASRRASSPMRTLNCAAVPEALLESELFGHERGAFTGATHAKPGLLEAADGGTLLLDEVAELPLSTQAKLLRAIERGEIQRLGSVAPKRVDVRFIAATNVDLAARAARDEFRRDLYFRLNGITIAIPPLRERASEIRALAEMFLSRVAESNGGGPRAFSAASIAMLERHTWPGNVRELRNVVERAAALCTGPLVGVEHLVLDRLEGAKPATPRTPRTRKLGPDAERQRIVDALAQTKGNQSEACKILGMSRRTLLHRLDEFDLARPRRRS
jgi:DNA-binding NtrC family response regulator